MAVYSLTVDGVERELRVDGFDISASLNGPDSLRGDFISDDASFRPQKREEIIFTIDAVRKFAGFIKSVRERGVDGPGGDGGDGIVSTITAEDYSGQTRRRFITVTIAAGQNIKQALQAIMGATDLEGVVLAAGQANGPTLVEPFDFVAARVSDAFDAVIQVANELDAVGWYWRINYDGDLQAFAPGSVAAPFNLVEGEGSECGDVETEDDENEDFANKVIVDGGSLEVNGHEETFVSNGVSATYQLEYTPLRWWTVLVGGTVMETIGTSPAKWTLDPVAKTITRVAGVLAAATTVSLTFDGRIDILGEAVTGTAAASPPTGVVESRVTVDGLTTIAQANARAAAIVATLSASTKLARYPTYRSGLAPGQTQTLTAAKRNLSGAWLIRDVKTIYDGAAGTDGLRYDVVLSEGGIVKGDFRQTYRQWIEGGGRSTAVAVAEGATAISTTPGGADGDVQINQAGVFGADTARFTYDLTAHKLIVDNIGSRGATNLAVVGGVGGASHGGNVDIAGGAASANGSNGGSVSIVGGSPSAGSSTTAGAILIKSGNTRTNPGSVTITTGSFPAASASLGTQIVISVATPAGSTAGTAVTGGAVSISAGIGQADAGSALGNGAAGHGGAMTVAAGAGGAETQAGNTRTGGTGGQLSLTAGAGGNAPAAGGTTNNGGNGGDVVLTPGAGGTGSTANGIPGGVKIPAAYLQFTEMTAPAAGATNSVRVYVEDNGAGKTRLMALFPTGAAQQIAIEP